MCHRPPALLAGAISAGIFAATMSTACPLRAQEEPLPIAPTASPDPPPIDHTLLHRPSTDPMLVTGILDVALGASFVALGVLLPEAREQGSFVGAGLGTMAVGVPMIAAGAKPVSYARRDTPLFTFGSALVSVGGTLTGAAFGYLAGDALERGRAGDPGATLDPALAAGAGAFGATFAAFGAGLMVAGSAAPSFEERSHELALRDERREREALRERDTQRADAARRRAALEEGDGTVPRSPARRTTGQVLVVLGGASLVCSVPATVLGLVVCSGRFCPSTPTIVGGALFANAVVASGVGIPLWVTGAQRIPEEASPEDTTWIPEVRVGAGNASVTMRF